MGKWDKLSSKLDSVLESLTQEDWLRWDSEKSIKNQAKMIDVTLKASIQAMLISSTCSKYPVWYFGNVKGEENHDQLKQPPLLNILSNQFINDSDFFESFFFSNIAA